MLKHYVLLSDEERRELLKYIQGFEDISSLEEMDGYFLSLAYNHGHTFFVGIIDGKVLGTAGLITKEIPYKDEAFLTKFYVHEEHTEVARDILRAIEKFINCKVKIKVGIKPHLTYLAPLLKDEQYHNTYNCLIYQLDDIDSMNTLEPLNHFEVRPLERDNQAIFRKIHNDAFLTSPNGAILNEQEMLDLVNENIEKKKISGIAYYKNRPIGIYDLTIVDLVGWIETIGIHGNDQGKGYGKYVLKSAIDILMKKGCEVIHLIVIDKNYQAINLYNRYGFTKIDTLSHWYEKTLT